MRSPLRLLFSLLVALGLLHGVRASHAAGAEIYWECVAPGTYDLRLVIYRDCAGTTFNASQTLRLTSPCGQRNVTLDLISSTEVSQLCNSQLANSNCRAGGSQPGILELVYGARVSGLQACNSWRMHWTMQYRNNAVNNVSDPSATELWVQAHLNNADAPCNDSPRFTNQAIPYLCVGQEVNYSFGVFDPEGDSLQYSLVEALGADGDPVVYRPGRSGAVPIPGLVFDERTGMLSFTAPAMGNYVVVVRVDQYDDNGVWAGAVYRDMQFVVVGCTNQAPDRASGVLQTVTGQAILTGPRAITVCESGDFCATLEISDPDHGNVVHLSSNIAQNLPGATFTYTAGNPARVQICWDASAGAAGFYPFIITANDAVCPIPGIQTYVYAITVPPGLATAVNNTPTSCADNNDGLLTVTVDRGTSPFRYAWSNGDTTASINVGSGSYSVTVSDAVGCRVTEGPFVVTNGRTRPTANAGNDVFGCMADLPITLNGTATNNNGAWWSGGTGVFTGTGANVTYRPTANEIRSGGVELTFHAGGIGACRDTSDKLLLILPNSFRGMRGNATGVSCHGNSDGTATITPDDPMLSYLWSPSGATTASATGLSAGTHTVRIDDAFGCDTSLTLNVTTPPALLISNTSVVHEQCAGQEDGTITTTVSGGIAPYRYRWSNGDTTANISVGAGSYTLTVTDQSGCSISSATYTVNALGQPNQVHAGQDRTVCSTDLPFSLSGTVQNASGGVWSGGLGSFSGSGLNVTYRPAPSEIGAGSIALVLTSTGNTTCPAVSDTIRITVVASFSTAEIAITPVNCHGEANGEAELRPAPAGTSFLWNDPDLQASAHATGLRAGTYQLLAMDSHGCDTTYTVTVPQPDALALAPFAMVAEQCAGNADGRIEALPSGGSAPYRYLWSTGDTTAAITATAGTYTLTVVDANGCTLSNDSAVINVIGHPNTVDAGTDHSVCFSSLPITLSGTVVNATDGIWSGGSGSFSGSGTHVSYMPTAAEIRAGSVALVLSSVGNPTCPVVRDTVTVRISTSFFGTAVTTQAAHCASDASGTATLAPVPAGTTLLWNDPAAQSSATATGLTAGSYMLHVQDSLGCDTTYHVTISEPDALVFANIDQVAPRCPSSSDGEASVRVSGGVLPYSVNWEPSGARGLHNRDIAGGMHQVRVTDSNGCTTIDSVLVQAPAPLQLEAWAPDTVCVNAPVQLTAHASGGTAPLFVHWTGIGTGDTLVHAFPASRDVLVQITDGAGCTGPTVQLSVHVLDLALARPLVTGDTVVCPGDRVLFGTELADYPGSYTIAWPGTGLVGPGLHSIHPTADTTLLAVVTDGCSEERTVPVHVRVDRLPVITLPAIIAEGCAPLQVQMPGNLSSVPATLTWHFGDGSQSTGATPTHLYTAGEYSVVLHARTALGCNTTATNTGRVIAHALPNADFVADPWTTDMNAPTIRFTSTAQGPAPFDTYHWTFGDGGLDNGPEVRHTYTDVGTFLVHHTVVDIHGCSSTTTNTVTVDPVYDIVIPNVFTPKPDGSNGGYYDPNDLSNDVFYPFVRFVKEFEMRVFNRWGELVFESRDLRYGWDGYYRGQPSQQDVYVYQLRVRFLDDKEVTQQGDLMLLR